MLSFKNIFTVLCLFFALNSASYAQQRNFEIIESEKVAYITKELKLSPADAQKFFPIYNKYNEEIWDLRKEKKSVLNRSNSLNANKDILSFDAKEVEIKKRYRSEFSKVIGQAKASQFFQVVEDFNELLRKSLIDRKNKR